MGTTGIARSVSAAVWGAAAIVSSACSTSAEDVPPLSDNQRPVTTPESKHRTEDDAVVSAYDRFWPQLTEASSRAETEWASLLAEVAVEPQLSRSVAGIRELSVQSRVIYGEVTARVGKVDVSGDTASLSDCQDASRSGQADATTGDPKTVGVARNPVTARLALGEDGEWRVAEISYPGGTC